MDKTTQQILMIAGVGVAAFLIYRTMKKGPQERVGPTGIGTEGPSPEEVFDPIDYVMHTWGLGENEAREVMDYVERTIKPNKDWVNRTVKKGKAEGRTEEQSLLYSAVWHLYYKDDGKYKGQRYVMDTWGLGENEAREIMDYVERTIKPNKDWVNRTVEKGKAEGRTEYESLLNSAVWHLYYKDDAKYKGQRVMP